MYRYGHYGAALLCYAPVGFVTLLFGAGELAVLGGVVTLTLAMLPDYDLRVPGLSHRGPTHTVLFAVCVGAALAWLTAVLTTGESPVATLLPHGPTVTAPFAFLVATTTILSHVAADALTPAGVRPFWPLSNKRYTIAVARASNPLANGVLFVIGVLATVSAAAAGSLT